MQLNIRLRNVERDEELRDSIDRRVRFALARFGDRIERADIVLTDVNGPRGGWDQRCMLKVVLPPTKPAVIEVTDCDALAAVGRACDRAVRHVRDQLARRRDLKRRIGFVLLNAVG